MDFKKAEQLKEKNKKLIGLEYNGATIEELVLFPTNEELLGKFEKLYLLTLDGEKAILPFIGTDVDVVAIFDKASISRHNVLFHTSIFSLPEDFDVITE